MRLSRVALLAAVGLLAAGSVAIVAAGGETTPDPDTPVTSAPLPGPGQSAPTQPNCRASTRLGAIPRQITFEIGGCDFEPSRLVVDPSNKLISAHRNPVVEGGDPQGDPGQGLRCNLVRRGDAIECTGLVEDGATIKGAMRVEGRRCRASTRFELTGGVDCDGGEACIELAVLDEVVDRRPAGC